MLFKDLSIGDTFELEDKKGTIKYIKIQEISIHEGENYVNAVCIDGYRQEKGQLEYISDEKSCSHINWS